MDDEASVLKEFRVPPRSSAEFYVPPEYRPNPVSCPPSPSLLNDQKDLVTLLQVLSNILGQTKWINFELVKALDGAKLGSGSTFTVRRHRLSRHIYAHNRSLEPGDIVVLKIAHGYIDGTFIDASKVGGTVSKQMDALIREIRVLTNQRVSQSAEIVDLLDITWEYEQKILRPVLVIEYAECGTLDDFIQSGRTQDLRVKAALCHDVATGLAVLHREGIVHGDVKCENVVVFEEREGLLKAKLIDFGLCIFFMEQDPGVQITVGGTLPFQAPEVISPVESDALVYTDCFSFGMLVWQFLLDGIYANDLFRQDPFKCPARSSSESSWISYIQAAKEDPEFISNVKHSVSLSLGEDKDIEDTIIRLYFEDVFDNTLDRIPTKRSLGRILTWWRKENGPDVEWCLRTGAQHSKPIQKLDLALNLTQFSQSPPTLQTQIFRNLEKISQDKEDKRSDEACFLLAQCYFDGIGTSESDEKGFKCLSSISSTHKVAGLALTRMRARSPNDEYCEPVATPDPATYPIPVSSTPLQALELLSPSSNLWPRSDENQNSILHWAATFGLSEHLSLFLAKFPELIEAQNEVGETPLICAARHGNKTCVEILVGSGARTDHVSYAGETALHWLVSFPDGVIERVGNLLFSFESLSGSSLVKKSYIPSVAIGPTLVPGTPLHRAVALGRMLVVRFLLDHGADCYSSGNVKFNMAALESAKRADDYESLGAKLPIQLACAAHDDRMIELLLNHQSAKLPLWTSQKKLPRGIVASMQLDKGDGLGCPKILSSYLLGYACEPISRFSRMCIHGNRQKKGLQRTFEILLSIPGLSLERVDYKGRSALLTACMAGDTELVAYLLSLPECSPTLETSYIGGWGLKPLHIAAAQNCFVMTKALLDAGANILAKRLNGDTAMVLCAASLLPDLQIPRLLLSREPQLASLQTQGDTPFSVAVKNHNFDCATLLLENGADPNQLTGPGATSTVLFQVLAVEYDITAVKFLLEIPNISLIVSPQKRFTAFHASAIGMLRYDYYDEFGIDGRGAVYEFLLNKWNKKEHLEACEIRGYTALHCVCLARDPTSIESLLPAMMNVGADVNIMTGFFGSPVWKTALDIIDDRSSVPSILSMKGPTAVQLYKENTERMREKLIAKGAKSRNEVLKEKWGELSYFERVKAMVLSYTLTKPFAILAGFLHVVALSGTNIYISWFRAWLQSNPEEAGPRGEVQGRSLHTITKQTPQSKGSANTVRLASDVVVRFGTATVVNISDLYGKLLTLLSHIGLREEDVAAGHHRLRWRNIRGKWLYDDYIEHEIGALQALKDYLNSSVYISETTDANGSRQTPDSASPSAPSMGCVRADFSESADISEQTLGSGKNALSSPSQKDLEKGSPSTNSLHLLCCIDERKHSVYLHEELVTDITNDRHLFQVLHSSYYEHRGKLKRYWSLRTVHSIHFMKFAYGGRGHIDVRCHNEICIQGQPCICLPPENLVSPLGSDYQCSPIPSQLSPPIGPRLMMDLFTKPEDIEPNSELVLRQLPKWLGGKLPSQCVERKEAWGVYYKEDWDWIKIWWILGLGFFPPSLLFGILWGVLKHDIQGAFGIASWWMTGTTILLGIVGINT